MNPREFVIDEADLRRVLADESLPNHDARARALGCSTSTLKKAIRKHGLHCGSGRLWCGAGRSQETCAAVPDVVYGPICEGRAQQLFQAVLLEMWRVALELSFDKASDYERAAARRWFGSADFDLVCQFAGVDPDILMARFRAARARMRAAPRPHDRRRTAVERIAASICGPLSIRRQNWPRCAR